MSASQPAPSVVNAFARRIAPEKISGRRGQLLAPRVLLRVHRIGRVIAPLAWLAVLSFPVRLDVPAEVRGCRLDILLPPSIERITGGTSAPAEPLRANVSEAPDGARLQLIGEDGVVRLTRVVRGGYPSCAALADGVALVLEAHVRQLPAPSTAAPLSQWRLTERAAPTVEATVPVARRRGELGVRAGGELDADRQLSPVLAGARSTRARWSRWELATGVAASLPHGMSVPATSGTTPAAAGESELRFWRAQGWVGGGLCSRAAALRPCLMAQAGVERLGASSRGPTLAATRTASAWRPFLALEARLEGGGGASKLSPFLALSAQGRLAQPEIVVDGAYGYRPARLTAVLSAGGWFQLF
jgi:hypothetical protein